MAHFIFMLTMDDKTIENAHAVFEEIKDLDLQYVGFKDIGLPFDELKTLAKTMRASGKTVMLEVVSERKEDELRSARAALELGVDYVLGGTHANEVSEILRGSGIEYCPFPGTIVGHPSLLRGTIGEIADSARRLAAVEGVGGLDLLAYRHDGDVGALIEAVVAAVEVPVIAAGSIDSEARIANVSKLGVWGFTVGTAVFEMRFATGEKTMRGQIEAVLAAALAHDRGGVTGRAGSGPVQGRLAERSG